MKTPLFRYVGLCIDKDVDTHAREFEINSLYKKGDEVTIWDEEDRRSYTYRILRFEGTVYNKSAEEVAREREVKSA